MSELLNQLWTPELQAAFTVVVVLLVILYVLSIVWVEADFVLCPNCHQRLKNLCGTCNHALDPTWTVCPYCATPVAGGPRTRRAPQQRGARTQQPQQAATQQQTRQARPAQSEHGVQ